jgi:hypothetical protein
VFGFPLLLVIDFDGQESRVVERMMLRALRVGDLRLLYELRQHCSHPGENVLFLLFVAHCKPHLLPTHDSFRRQCSMLYFLHQPRHPTRYVLLDVVALRISQTCPPHFLLIEIETVR